jgi:hypothetical protein
MKREFRFVDVIEAPAGRRARIPILSTGKRKTKRYGWIEVTNEMLSNFKKAFENAGEELCVDYDHGTAIGDSPDARKAAGWIKELEHVDGVLYGLADMSPTAAQYLANQEYRYASAEWNDNAEDSKTGEEIGPALQAVAITNRPVWKGLESIEVMCSARAEREMKTQEREESNVKINLSDFGGPREADPGEAVTFLIGELQKVKADATATSKRLSEAERAAGTSAEAHAQLAVLKKELDDERTIRRAEAKERFFSEHRTKIGAEERAALEPIYDSGEDGPTKALAMVRIMPDKYRETPKGSGGNSPANAGSATSRFMSACHKVMVEEKKTFTDASIAVASRDRKLFSEYEAERDRISGFRGRSGQVPSGEEVN